MISSSMCNVPYARMIMKLSALLMGSIGLDTILTFVARNVKLKKTIYLKGFHMSLCYQENRCH